MSKKFLLTVVILFLLSACSVQEKSEQEVRAEIYTDIINSYTCKDQVSIINSVIHSRSFSESDWQWLSQNMPQLKRETWDNFVQVNSRQSSFPGDLDLDCELKLQDLKQDPADWYQEIFSFSQIGFDADRTQAIVPLYHFFAGSGTVYMYFAEIVEGRWEVTNSTLLSIID